MLRDYFYSIGSRVFVRGYGIDIGYAHFPQQNQVFIHRSWMADEVLYGNDLQESSQNLRQSMVDRAHGPPANGERNDSASTPPN